MKNINIDFVNFWGIPWSHTANNHVFAWDDSFTINPWKSDDTILETPKIPWCLKNGLINVLYAIVCRGVQSPTWKTESQHKQPIPTSNDIIQVRATLSDLHKNKFSIHSSYLEYILQKVFKMTEVKLTIGRLSLIGIYWYQWNNRFINCCLFMHSHKGGLTIDVMIRVCSRNLGQYSFLAGKDTLWKRTLFSKKGPQQSPHLPPYSIPFLNVLH